MTSCICPPIVCNKRDFQYTGVLRNSGSTTDVGTPNVIGLIGVDGSKVVVVGSSIVTLFSINDEGQNVNIGTIELPNDIFLGRPKQIRSSKDGELFSPDVRGRIINSDLQVLGFLSDNPFANFLDYVFSDNKEKIWGLTSAELIEVSFPSFVENNRTALNYQALSAIKDGDDIIIVGIVTDSFTGAQKTIVDRVAVGE
jgi:hypothetical protein